MRSILKAKRAILLVLVFVGSIGPTPTEAGLFGSIGNALGIHGDVGNALNFADGFIPGGGGPTDSILGVPANAAFGTAIKNWGDTNARSIQKLGETNDNTVKKLLAGLNQLQGDVSADIDKLSDSLNSAVGTLDDSLDKNITTLDNDLSSQTSRLDTIFQRQTNTFFFLGRVFLSALIVGALMSGLIRLAGNIPERDSIWTYFKQHRVAVCATVGVGLMGLVAAWIWPDPSHLSILEKQYRHSYQTAISFEDFQRSYNDASQLSVLDQTNDMYRAWEIKNKTYRDVFLRPTELQSDSRIAATFASLSQSNDYYVNSNKSSDPDVVGLYALISGIKAGNEGAILSASIATAEAARLYNTATSESTFQISAMKNQTYSAMRLFQSSPLPIDFVRIAFSEAAGQSAILSDQYAKSIMARVPSVSKMDGGGEEMYQVNSIGQMGNTFRDKMIVRKFYKGFSAKYFELLMARAIASGSGADDAKSEVIKRYCELFGYYDKWSADNFAQNSDDPVFVSNYLAGPFEIPARSTALQGASTNACKGLPEEKIKIYADQISLWTDPLSAHVPPGSRKGVALIRSAASISKAQQDAAFSAFEGSADGMAVLFAQGTGADLATRHDRLLQFADQAAVLGLSAESGDGSYIPAVFDLYRQFGSALTLGEWRRAFLAYLQSEHAF